MFGKFFYIQKKYIKEGQFILCSIARGTMIDRLVKLFRSLQNKLDNNISIRYITIATTMSLKDWLMFIYYFLRF